MKRNLGSAWGSILAMRAGIQAQEAANRPRVVKSERQLHQEEFDQIRAEHERDYIDVEVPNSEYDAAIDGRATKMISVPRKQYEDKMGITGVRQVWSQSAETLVAMEADKNPLTRIKMIDPGARLPLTPDGKPLEMNEETFTKVTEQAHAFARSHNLTNQEFAKVVLFVGVHHDGDSRTDVLNPEIWGITLGRLTSLGCIRSQSQPQETPLEALEPPADILREQAETDYLEKSAGPLWSAFLDYLARTFNFYPSEKQSRWMIDFVVDHGLQCLDPESWQTARRAAVRSQVLPDTCLDADDRLCIDLERIDTSTPQGRAEFARRKAKLIYQS